MIAVFDLDGTVCDNSHRAELARQASEATGAKADLIWKEFHDGLPNDGPIAPVLAIMRTLMSVGEHVEIWTARPERYRLVTREWLRKHDVYIRDERLLMRPNNDWRPAPILKLEWFILSKSSGVPEIVFEDHAETTRLLRMAGAIVAQVGERG